MIEILFWLFTKHFVFDFLLQTPYQFLNKGKYGHFGGILHSGLQGLGTLLILGPIAALIDFVVHYHVDWAKVQINSRYAWHRAQELDRDDSGLYSGIASELKEHMQKYNDGLKKAGG